jgi:hypothetical protein
METNEHGYNETLRRIRRPRRIAPNSRGLVSKLATNESPETGSAWLAFLDLTGISRRTLTAAT